MTKLTKKETSCMDKNGITDIRIDRLGKIALAKDRHAYIYKVWTHLPITHGDLERIAWTTDQVQFVQCDDSSEILTSGKVENTGSFNGLRYWTTVRCFFYGEGDS